MSKKITIKYDNQDYVLEFDRATSSALENMGFVKTQLLDKPNIMIPLLVQGAFVKNHGDLTGEMAEKIFASLPNKSDLLFALCELYEEPINGLLVEADNSKNSTWKASW